MPLTLSDKPNMTSESACIATPLQLLRVFGAHDGAHGCVGGERSHQSSDHDQAPAHT